MAQDSVKTGETPKTRPLPTKPSLDQMALLEGSADLPSPQTPMKVRAAGEFVHRNSWQWLDRNKVSAPCL